MSRSSRFKTVYRVSYSSKKRKRRRPEQAFWFIFGNESGQRVGLRRSDLTVSAPISRCQVGTLYSLAIIRHPSIPVPRRVIGHSFHLLVIHLPRASIPLLRPCSTSGRFPYGLQRLLPRAQIRLIRLLSQREDRQLVKSSGGRMVSPWKMMAGQAISWEGAGREAKT